MPPSVERPWSTQYKDDYRTRKKGYRKPPVFKKVSIKHFIVQLRIYRLEAICIVPVYVSVRSMFQSPNYNYKLHMVKHLY